MLRPLAGTVVRPVREGRWRYGVKLFVRLRFPHRPGRYGFRALRLSYHWGYHRKTIEIADSLIVCVDRPMRRGGDCRSSAGASG